MQIWKFSWFNEILKSSAWNEKGYVTEKERNGTENQ